MEVTFWGTGASEGWPALFCDCPACRHARKHGERRTRAQLSIDDELLVDFGPDTYAHALQHGVCLSRIRAVLITHSHSDHLYTPDLGCILDNYNPAMDLNPLTVYGNEAVTAAGEALKAGYAGWAGLEKLLFQTAVPGRWLQLPGARALPLQANHIPHETCLIYVVEKDGRRILYGCDSGLYPEETNRALSGLRLDMAVLECTMLAAPAGHGHCSLTEMRRRKQLLTECGAITPDTKVYISHLCHSGGLSSQREIEEAVAGDGIRVAYDGLRVIL